MVDKQQSQEVPAVEDTKVVIEFGDFSYRDSLEMSKLDAMTAKVSIYQNMGDNLTPDMLKEMLTISSPEFLTEVFNTVSCIMAKTVKHLPRSWFVSGAPDLPYSDPKLYEYLRGDKVQFLRKLIQERRDTEIDTAKN